VIVAYGVSVPKGHLPVFSVGSAAEAKYLLRLTCPTNARGQFIARELVLEQTLQNLAAFGERLRRQHDAHVRGTRHCTCKEAPP